MSNTNDVVFLTGANGFLGAWVTRILIQKGIRVIATDVNNHNALLRNLLPNPDPDLIDFQTCDVTNAEAVNTLIGKEKPGAIIHLAALQIPECRRNPGLGAAVNIGGQINLFEAARHHGVPRVLYTSSIAAKPRGPENAPANFYGIFKKTGEEIARLYWQHYQLPSLGLRPCIVYGVGRDDGETSVITRAMEAAARGQSFTLPFRTESSFQYVGDVAEVIARAALSDWQGSLLSDITDTIATTDQVIAAIRDVVPDANVDTEATDRISPTSGFDIAPLRQVIGDWQETPLESGTRQTIDMFRALDQAQKAAS